MGANAAADKWKWLAINTMDHTLPRFNALLDHLTRAADPASTGFIEIKDNTLPKLEALLDNLSQAVDPIAAASLRVIEQTEETISLIRSSSVTITLIFIFLVFPITFILLYLFIRHQANLDYVRFQYGGTIQTMARTYANLMKFHLQRVRRHGIGIDAERTNIILIGAGETVEPYLRHDDEFSTDDFLQSLLPESQPFVFRTIKDAMHTLDVCCTSEQKLPKTLFILLLISTQDPTWEQVHQHETFQMPSRLRDHCYAIVGVGLGENGQPVHKLSGESRGPNGELLSKSLPLGAQNAGVCFGY